MKAPLRNPLGKRQVTSLKLKDQARTGKARTPGVTPEFTKPGKAKPNTPFYPQVKPTGKPKTTKKV